jgi:hypothetical protein
MATNLQKSVNFGSEAPAIVDSRGSLDALEKIAHSAIKAAFAQNLGGSDFSIVGVTHLGHRVLAQWMVMNCIAGDELSGTLKIHYNLPWARTMHSQREKGVRDLSDAQVHGFMKTVCSQISREVSREFMDSGISCGSTLPITLRGFDHVYSEIEHRESYFDYQWKLSSPIGSLYGAFTIRAIASHAVAKIVKTGS